MANLSGLLDKFDRNVMDLMSHYNFEKKKIFPAKDRTLCWRNFELLGCYITRTIPWGQLPIEYRDQLNITYRKDCGIDGMSDTISMQAKFRGKNSRVSWDEVAKFIALSLTCGKSFDKLILCSNADRISNVQDHAYEKLVISGDHMQSVLDELKRKHLELRSDVEDNESIEEEDNIKCDEVEKDNESVEKEDNIECDEVVEKDDIIECDEPIEKNTEEQQCDKSIEKDVSMKNDRSTLHNMSMEIENRIEGACSETKPSYELRPYQVEALSAVKTSGVTKISLPCGTGKTYLIHALCKDPNQRVAIFVPTRVLLEQTYMFMKQYDIEVERVGTTYNDSFDDKSRIFVCVFDSAYRLKDISFDTKIVDEAHLALDVLKIDEDIVDDDLSSDNVLDDADSSSDDVSEANDALRSNDASASVARPSSDDTTQHKTRGEIIRDIKATRTILLSATISNADHIYELRDAINDNVLTDYDVTIPIYSSIPDLQQQVDFISHNKQFIRILAYCNSLKTAKELQETCIARKIPAGYFDGNTDMYTRMRIIDKLSKGEIRILCTVRTIGVGTNIPSADTCWFVEERRSVIDVIQCVGRVLRKSDDKIISHIILPFVVTTEDNIDEAYIRNMSRFMKIMSDYDYNIKRRRDNKRLHSRFIINRSEKELLEETSILLDTAIFNRMGIMIAGQWMIRYEELKAFVEKYGRLPKQGKDKLGSWCNKQRQVKRGQSKGLMTEERIKLLESIPGWYWEKPDEWLASFEELKTFAEEHNRVPKNKENNLDRWCKRQRSLKKEQRRDLMTEERIKLLESIPGWYWEKPDEWMPKFEELKAFVEKYGRLPKQEENSLGMWCGTQRQAKKGQGTNIMTEERIKLLESIPGWYWEKPDKWMPKFEELKAFVEKYGRLPKQEENSLGMWCSTQRRAKKGQGGLMTEERIKLLESIPQWHWEKVDEWTPKFEELKGFVEKHKRLPMKKENTLGRWCQTQRQVKRGQSKGLMTEERIKLLESIPGWHWEKPDEWTTKFNELKMFVKEYHKLPTGKGNSLAYWCQDQRKAKKGQREGCLITEERIKLLEAMPYWFWDSPDSQEHFINILKDYVDKYNRLPDCTSNTNTPVAHNNYDIKPYIRRGYCKRTLDEKIQKEFDDIIYKYEPNSPGWKPKSW